MHCRKRIDQEQKFYLLHISVLREFLELEFGVLKKEIKDFEFDFEKIVDDFVLFCFFVGNDFLPNLPSMYIPNGSLGVIFEVYKSILPSLGKRSRIFLLILSFSSFSFSFSFSIPQGGYINENGYLNLKRCERLIQELSENEKTAFDNEKKAELLAKQRKQRRGLDSLLFQSFRQGIEPPITFFFTLSARVTEPVEEEIPTENIVLTSNQKVIFQQLKVFHEESKRRSAKAPQEALHFPSSLSQKERSFIKRVAQELCLNVEMSEGIVSPLCEWAFESSQVEYNCFP